MKKKKGEGNSLLLKSRFVVSLVTRAPYWFFLMRPERGGKGRESRYIGEGE